MTRADRLPSLLSPAGALASGRWWCALGVLVLNDHFLKSARLVPGALTGKLSDVAGLLLAPPLAAALFRARRRETVLAAHSAVAMVFAALKLSCAAAATWTLAWAKIGVPYPVCCDRSDLWCLPALTVSWAWFTPRMRAGAGPRSSRWLAAAAMVLGVTACAGSSAPRPPLVAASGGQVFAPRAGHLVTIDIASGKQAVGLPVSASAYDRPAVLGSVLYLPSLDGRVGVTAFDLEARAPRWQTPLSHSVRQLTVGEPGVLVITSEPRLVLMDRATGARRWETSMASSPGEAVAFDRDLVLLRVAGGIEGRDAATGAIRWQFEGGKAAALGDPERGEVYAVDWHNAFVLRTVSSLHALDRASGAVRWSIPIGAQIRGVGFEAGAIVLSGDRLEVVDASTRALRWSADCEGPAAAERGMVVCRTGGSRFSAWDLESGRPVWSVALPDVDFCEGPVIASGDVLVSSSTSRLFALDLATGRLRWSLDLAEKAEAGAE